MKSIGTFRRFKEVMVSAPWSVYDLLSSAIVSGIGLYLLASPGLFRQVGGVYATLATVTTEWVWGWLYLSCGIVGIGATLWCERPSFLSLLLARMGIAFCLLCFALNNLLYDPPPLSTVTYVTLSICGLWGIVRTKASGR